jgi:hypothetical protein
MRDARGEANVRPAVRIEDEHFALAADMLRRGHPPTIREFADELRRQPAILAIVKRYRLIEEGRFKKTRFKH